MSVRTDVTVNWELSPRLVEINLPSTELSAQDAADTLRSLEHKPAPGFDVFSHDYIIDVDGKQNLGDSLVGITLKYLNGQAAFGRTASRSSGTVTTGSTTQLIDSAADFVADNVRRGDWVINFADQSVTEVLEVVDLNTLNVRTLSDGTDNDFDIGDSYKVWAVEEATLTGGNQVAVDSVGATINPLFTTFGRFATVQAASSPTLQELSDIQHASYGGGITVNAINGVDGTVHPAGNQENPVKTIANALIRAAAEGFDTIFVINSVSIEATDDVSNMTLIGQSPSLSTFTFVSGCVTERTEIRNAEIKGVMGGAINAFDCHFETTSGIGSTANETNIHNCLLEPGTITLNTMAAPADAPINFINCWSGAADELNPVTLDMGGADGADVNFAGWDGVITITNCSDANRHVSWRMVAGEVNLAASVTAGELHFYGVGELNHTQTGTEDIHKGGLLDPRDSHYQLKIINNLKEIKLIAGSYYLIIYDTGEVSGGVEILRKKLTDISGNDITAPAAGALAAELETSV